MPPPHLSLQRRQASVCLSNRLKEIERSGEIGPPPLYASAVIWNGHKIMRNHSSSCWMEVQDRPQRHHCCATPCLPQAKTTSGCWLSALYRGIPVTQSLLWESKNIDHIFKTKNNKIQFWGSCSFVLWEKIRVAQMHQDWPTKKMTTNLTAPPGHPEWIHLVAAAIHPQDWPACRWTNVSTQQSRVLTAFLNPRFH